MNKIEYRIQHDKIRVGEADGSTLEGYECFTYVPLHSDDGLLNTYNKHQMVRGSPYFVFKCEWTNGDATLLQKFNFNWIATRLVAGEHYVLNAYNEHGLVPYDIAKDFIDNLQSGGESVIFKEWNNKYEDKANYNKKENIVAVLKYIIG